MPERLVAVVLVVASEDGEAKVLLPLNTVAIYLEISTFPVASISVVLKMGTEDTDHPVALLGFGLPIGTRTGTSVTKGPVAIDNKKRTGALMSPVTVSLPR